MNSKVAEFKKKVTSKVVPCPSCQQKIRIPVRPGKSLEIRCQKCGTTFQINFQSPFGEVFKWDKSLPFLGNIKQMKYALSALTSKSEACIPCSITPYSFNGSYGSFNRDEPLFNARLEFNQSGCL